MCSTVPSYDVISKLYTQKELVLIETPIKSFHEKFYIPALQKLGFHLPHVRILGTRHCGKERCGTFKHWGNFHDTLCYRDYEERAVSIFDNKTQS